MANRKTLTRVRNLVIVLGDQLNLSSAAFDGFDVELDAVLQIEAVEEATYIPQHKLRLAYFFSSMRHFHDELTKGRYNAFYSRLDDENNTGTLKGEIERFQRELDPQDCVMLAPGDWRVLESLRRMARPPAMRNDRHFLCSTEQFTLFCENHPKPKVETFYRHMRRELGILVDEKGSPSGGRWNFDAENRKSFGKGSMPMLPFRPRHEPDEITGEIVKMVNRHFASSPGHLNRFDLPVTREQALSELDDFANSRLALFGKYQDAMLGGETYLYHSRLSGPLNLHMIDPAEIVKVVLKHSSSAPLNSVEGFIRQVIGWREFVRGIYWQRMPHYADENALDARLSMPRFYWSGETDMECLSEAIGHTIDSAYAHHIERLMVLGLFVLLLGVRPYEVHRWHMSMFWDAIDWVSLPNTLGMSQYGDGGMLGTKPYAASGQYIDRMSDHCGRCRYDPKKSAGEDACPFTSLYWDFLARNRNHLESNRRMKMQYANLDRKNRSEILASRRQAAIVMSKLT